MIKMVKQGDWSEEISKIRNILRKSTVSGERSDDVGWALSRLKELAAQEDDTALGFEYQRWSVHVAGLKAA